MSAEEFNTLRHELEEKEDKLRTWMKQLDDRVSKEEIATVQLVEREKTAAGTVDWATLRASFSVIVVLWSLGGTGLGFYLGSKTEPINKELERYKTEASGRLSSLSSEIGSKASKSDVTALTNTVTSKASADALNNLSTRLQVAQSDLNSKITQVAQADDAHIREIKATIAAEGEKVTSWQADFGAQFTSFRINTNDKLARIDILCSLIRQTKTEIRKLDAINNQSIAQLYAEINSINRANGAPQIVIPERPGETGRDVSEC